MEFDAGRRRLLKNSARGLMGIVAAGIIGGCYRDRDHNEFQSYDSHPVDQVFRDHDGFRLIYTDGEGILRENKYFSTLINLDNGLKVFVENMPEEIGKKFKYNAPLEFREVYEESRPEFHQPFLIIKDLKEGERGFANTIKHKYVRRKFIDLERSYIEVHLPRNQNISPGNEVFGGKFKVESEMHEVK